MACTVAGSWTARIMSAWFSAPIASAVALYQASGSRLIHSSAGFSVCAKNHQCHHMAANRASQRSSASTTGIPSSTARCVMASGASIASRKATEEPRSWPATAKRSCPSARISASMSRAIARLDACSWSGAVGGAVDSP